MLHYLYAQTSAMVTNCVKAVPLSQTEGQKILTAQLGAFPGLLEQAREARRRCWGWERRALIWRVSAMRLCIPGCICPERREGNDIVWRKDETVCPM